MGLSPRNVLPLRRPDMETLLVEGSQDVKFAGHQPSQYSQGIEGQAAEAVDATRNAAAGSSREFQKSIPARAKNRARKSNASPYLPSTAKSRQSLPSRVLPATPIRPGMHVRPNSDQASRRRALSEDSAEGHIASSSPPRTRDISRMDAEMNARRSQSPHKAGVLMPQATTSVPTRQRDRSGTPLGAYQSSPQKVFQVSDSDDEHDRTSRLEATRRSPKRFASDTKVATSVAGRHSSLLLSSRGNASSKPRQGGGVHTDDIDEPEPIEQFSSPPDSSSITDSMGLLPGPPAVYGASKRRRPMQDRNGNVPQQSNARPKVVAKTALTSSNLSRPLQIAAIEWCYADDDVNLLDASTLTVNTNTSRLSFTSDRGKRADFLFKAIQCLEIYNDQAPTLRLALQLTEREHKQLAEIRAVYRTDFNAAALFVGLKDEPSAHNAVEHLIREVGDRAHRIDGKVRDQFQQRIPKAAEELGLRPRRSAPAESAALAADQRSRQTSSRSTVSVNDRRLTIKGKAKEVDDDRQPKLNSYLEPLRRSSRTRGRASDIYAQYADDDLPVATTSRPARLDKDEVFVVYQDVLIQVFSRERYRIEDQDFLNDVALEFGLRYTLDNVCSEQLRSAIYLFSSFFYDMLSKKDKLNKPTDHEWPAYNAVKRWTRSVNIFDKDFIIVPINESFHWYTAVIINPRYVLADADQGIEARTSFQASSSSPDNPSPASSQAAGKDAGDNGTRMTTPHGPAAGNESRDELDVMSEDDGPVTGDVGLINESMDRMSIDGDHLQRLKDFSSPPRPIQSATLDVYNEQVKDMAVTRSGSSSPSKALPAKKSRADVDILKSKRTYILTFDSLGSTHRAAHRDLERWLHYEARHKLGKTDGDLREALYLEARVPTQPNFSDCGVYLIHYIDCLLSDPEGVLHFIGRVPPSPKAVGRGEWEKEMREVWRAADTATLRNRWVGVIDEQTAKWNSLQDLVAQDHTANLPPPEESQASVVLATQQAQTEMQVETSPPPHDLALDEGVPTSLITISSDDATQATTAPAIPNPGATDAAQDVDGSSELSVSDVAALLDAAPAPSLPPSARPSPTRALSADTEASSDVFGVTDISRQRSERPRTLSVTPALPTAEGAQDAARAHSTTPMASLLPSPATGTVMLPSLDGPSPFDRLGSGTNSAPNLVDFPGLTDVQSRGQQGTSSAPAEISEEEEEEKLEEPGTGRRRRSKAAVIASSSLSPPPPTSPLDVAKKRGPPSRTYGSSSSARRETVNSTLLPYRDAPAKGKAGSSRKRPPANKPAAPAKKRKSRYDHTDVIEISDDDN